MNRRYFLGALAALSAAAVSPLAFGGRKPLLMFRVTGIEATGPATLSMWLRKGDIGPFSRVVKEVVLTGDDQVIPIYDEDLGSQQVTPSGLVLLPMMTIDGVTIFWPQLETTSPYGLAMAYEPPPSP